MRCDFALDNNRPRACSRCRRRKLKCYTSRILATHVDQDLNPDILKIKHKGATYQIPFPPYSISEGHVRVLDLRRAAAKELKVDDLERVKMLYKGKSLRYDSSTCKEEDLKMNSEVFCIIASGSYRYESDADADDDDDSGIKTSSHSLD